MAFNPDLIDQFFIGVDTQAPAQTLAPGMVAEAVNKRFETGQAWPRPGVNLQPWGLTGRNLASGLNLTAINGTQIAVTITTFVVGRTYFYFSGQQRNEVLTQSTTGAVVAAGRFVATGTSYTLTVTGTATTAVRAMILQTANTCAFRRFNDPNGFDNLVVITDDWRDRVAEDGGRGRAWRVHAGQVPTEIPLNGHDVWGTARLISCGTAQVMLRHGNERHYFAAFYNLAITDTDATANTLSAASTSAMATGDIISGITGITGASGTYYARIVTTTTFSLYDTRAHAVAGGGTGKFDVTVNHETGVLQRHNIDTIDSNILLNAAPAWNDGDIVLYVPDLGIGSFILGTTPPGANTRYFVKAVPASNRVELYSDVGLTSKMLLDGQTFGRFYLERQATAPGFYGNGAPPLLMQPSALGLTAFENGFRAVPASVPISNTSAADDSLTAENHRLIPGDAFKFTGTITGITAGTKYFAFVVNDHTLKVYDTVDNALAGGSTGLQNLTADNQTGTLQKYSASGLAMPPAREGAYTANNRLVLINGKNQVVISDTLDYLHYTPFTSDFTAQLGESDNVVGVLPFVQDTILFIKTNAILVLNNFSAGPSAWALNSVTSEYGGIAALAALLKGADAWIFGRKGVGSILQTVQGKIQGVSVPASRPMLKYVEMIDWRAAAQAAAETLGNRYFLAAPLKGQTNGSQQNNGVLVYNSLNNAWEGLWQGDSLKIYGMAKQDVFGEERLCYVNYEGQVYYFGDGFTDANNVAISDRVVTRIYTGGESGRKVWNRVKFNWDTHNVNISVSSKTPGYNEVTALESDLHYDKTKYNLDGAADYVAGSTAFSAPGREDYTASASEILSGTPDAHQNITEPYRMREDDWGVQIQIENTLGSCRLRSVEVSARPIGGADVRTT